MASSIRVGGVMMSADDVCELLCNSEEIGDESVDNIDEDSDDLNGDDGKESGDCTKRVTHMEIIVDENECENQNEIDLNISVQDFFLDMINDDTDPGDLIDLNSRNIEQSDSEACNLSGNIPSRFTNTWNNFPLEFRDVEINCRSTEFEKVIWKKGNIQFNDQQVRFRGDISLPQNIMSLETPYQVWKFLFPESLEQHIVDETIKYAGLQETFRFDKLELRKYIGIVFYMTYHNLPNVRDYWSEKTNHSVNVIKNQMTVRRFEKIREFIHFNDKNSQPSSDDPHRDRLYLIRPIIDTLNKTFGSVPKQDRLCVDEQICSTKIRSYMKQYMPNKPKKWGFKLFVLCDTTGYAYKFEIYNGAPEIPAPTEPDLQPSANIVVRLLREVPRFQNFIIYFDNYYTTVPLVVYLRTQGILSVGTIRRNRIKNCKLPDEKTMQKFERGTSHEFICNIHGIDVTSLSWKDNKIVNLVSTYVGVKPISDSVGNKSTRSLTIKRFDKREKTVKMIPCPQIIKDYNKHMGGVDCMDSSMSRHKITIKSRKWTNRVFYHLLDMTVVNAWLLYKRINSDRPGFKPMRLIDFKLEIADTLFTLNTTQASVRGRPRIEAEIHEKIFKPNSHTPPPKDTRLDKIDHWTVIDKKGRCKFPKCAGQTRMYCTKCKVNLCLTGEKNCFYNYHNS